MRDFLGTEHAAVRDNHRLVQAEALAHFLGHRSEGGDIHCSPGIDGVRDGLAFGPDGQADDHLRAVIPVIARVPVLRQLAHTPPSK